MAEALARPILQVLNGLIGGRGIQPPEVKVAPDDAENLDVDDVGGSLVGI